MKNPSWSRRYYSTSTGKEPFCRNNDDGRSAAVLVADEACRTAHPRAGERLHHLFNETVARVHSAGSSDTVALEYADRSYKFAEIESLSIQLSHYLLRQGICPGDRVGLLLERSVNSVLAMLALSRLGCAYIPLDADFPLDRIEYMLRDSGASCVLILNKYEEGLAHLPVSLLSLDTLAGEFDKESSEPIDAEEDPADTLCYVIYTSGTTGRPKGVPINHGSLCNFLRVAAASYGYEAGDRVYQGMTIAFDFSVEELWVPLIVGSTIVPNAGNAKLLGPDLSEFLLKRRITALCCVPTLLATLDPEQLPLRFIMVSGEACPPALAVRWVKNDRRFLNTYGPTETTVSATWQVIEAGAGITIGGPLPSYSILILAPDETRALPPGESGEIAIAGVGLSDGYLNLPDKTADAFIEDFLGIENNPGGRIYRTGDLGRITSCNTIECLGRVDSQVKIRGYRIELDEIESIAMEVDAVAQGVVNVVESVTGHKELALFLTPAITEKSIDVGAVADMLRQRTPAYMVPAFVDVLEEFPLLPSGKVDRKRLPAPSGQRLISGNQPYVAPEPGLQTALAGRLAVELSIDSVSANAHFFNDLGADSLLMTRFVLSISTQLPDVRVSINQLYQNPSIIELAESMEAQADNNTSSEEGDWVNAARTAQEHSNKDVPLWQHWTCGIAQLSVLIVGVFMFLYLNVLGLHWIDTASSLAGYYGRALIVGFGVLIVWSAFLIALKWVAIGRFREESFPVWSFRYFRFWVARVAIQSNPLNLTRGSFLYSVFLRLLGAKIGKFCHIHAAVPVCTDLITIGDESLVREKAILPGYSAIGRYIHCAPVLIGSRAFVGPASVLGISTGVGDGAQLGTTSALYPGQNVPDGCKYHGSPARRTDTNHDRVAARPISGWQRVADGLAGPLMLSLLLGYPIAMTISAWALDLEGGVSLAGHMPGPGGSHLAAVTAFLLSVSLIGFFGYLFIELITVLVIPRLLRPFMVTGVAQPMFGFQYQLARTMNSVCNSKWLCRLFGDSSLILHYLRALGYDMREATQTGSNCGVEITQNSPFLCQFKRNTLASDGLNLMNMDMSYSSFILKSIVIPEDSYLGNSIHYPVDAAIGTNCLIATKAMIPIDGALKTNTGILGSPPFEIPRTVERDRQFDHYKSAEALPARLRLKLRSNLRTLGLYVFKTWSLSFLLLALAFLFAKVSTVLPHTAFGLAVAGIGFMVCSLLLALAYSLFFEHASQSFKSMVPTYCSLYDEDFWHHERFWKMSCNADAIMEIFNGTPLKPVLQRLRGLKIGKQIFDDGCSFPEPSLVEIGDGCTLNTQSIVQGHSLEDGTFKSDRVTIGKHCSLSTGAFVHYGCNIQDNSVLLNDAFLMKGSTMQAGSVWGGNPAGEFLKSTPVAAPIFVESAKPVAEFS